MKRILIMIGMLLVLSGYYGVVHASQPKRIAILPVINSTYDENTEAVTVITAKLNSHFKTPLSSIAQFYELIPRQDIIQAISPIPNKKAKLVISDYLLKEVTEKTKADITIAIRLDQYDSFMFITRDGGMIQQTDVKLVYGIFIDKQRTPYYCKTLQRHYYGDATAVTGPDYMLNELMDEISEMLRKQVALVH